MNADQGLALELHDIRIELANGARVVDGVTLSVRAGEIVGLVGESGSGKTTTALSIFGYTGSGLRCVGGDVVLAGEALADTASCRRARGRLVSYVPQNPGTALNPSLRIGAAIDDIIHDRGHDDDRRARLLQSVELPGDRQFALRFPHQLSGGQQQRVCIAGAIGTKPSLVVLDEPTTGLDVITQDRILKELLRLRDEEHVAMLYITHDLAVAAQIADTIAVMYAGELVEHGPAADVLRDPRHPYTRGLMASTPDHLRGRKLEVMRGIAVGVGEHPLGCSFAPRCTQAQPDCVTEHPALHGEIPGRLVRCPEWRSTPPMRWSGESSTSAPERPQEPAAVILEVESLRVEYQGRRGASVAVQDVSFQLERSGCLALVGESGSGKTTIARVIAGLHPMASGRVVLDGRPMAALARKRSTEQRRRVQIVFQNPMEALNPRYSVEATIARPAHVLRGLNAKDASAEVARLLDAVRLPAGLAKRYPRELSGGECQRVAIARALAANPEVLVCDEVTSALDVSVQAVVLDLLRDLRASLGLAIVFITHDLGVVATVADRVLVLQNGVICEEDATHVVLSEPRHEYTKSLLAAAPSLSASIEAWESGASLRTVDQVLLRGEASAAS
jgi:peptide/nickel transport system ATP-binding protein